MLQSPIRGHQITSLLINYVFKDSSFLTNEKVGFSLNIKIKKEKYPNHANGQKGMLFIFILVYMIFIYRKDVHLSNQEAA